MSESLATTLALGMSLVALFVGLHMGRATARTVPAPNLLLTVEVAGRRRQTPFTVAHWSGEFVNQKRLDIPLPADLKEGDATITVAAPSGVVLAEGKVEAGGPLKAGWTLTFAPGAITIWVRPCPKEHR